MADTYEIRYQYSAVRVNVPCPLAQNILEWSDQYVLDSLLYTDPNDPTFGREEEPHVTVLYGLHTADPRPVEKAVVKEKPGEVTLGKMSIFTSNDNFDVLKIEVESESLHRLQKMLVNNLTTTEPYPSYIPHVTIAYIKKGKADQFVGIDLFSKESFTADELLFSSKTGSKSIIKIGAK